VYQPLMDNFNDLSKVASTKSTLEDEEVVSTILHCPPQLPNGFRLRSTSDGVLFLSQLLNIPKMSNSSIRSGFPKEPIGR
jgi:hypothetical protein